MKKIVSLIVSCFVFLMCTIEVSAQYEVISKVIFDFVKIESGVTVCEVGAGKGNFTLRLAERVGSSGKIYANDIVQSKLDVLKKRAKEAGFNNIQTILGTETDPLLPKNTMDAIFIVDAFHDFSEKVEMLKRIAPALKQGGKLVIVDSEIDIELPKVENKARLLSREHFLSFIEKSPFRVDQIDDKSFPKDETERLVVYVLSLKKK